MITEHFIPATGHGKVIQCTSFAPKSLFWMTTGRGPMPAHINFEGGFVAKTSCNFEAVANGFGVVPNGRNEADQHA